MKCLWYPIQEQMEWSISSAGMLSFHECLGGLPPPKREERISLGGVRRGGVFIGFDRLPFPIALIVCECNIRFLQFCPRVMMMVKF